MCVLGNLAPVCSPKVNRVCFVYVYGAKEDVFFFLTEASLHSLTKLMLDVYIAHRMRERARKESSSSLYNICIEAPANVISRKETFTND